MLVLDVVLAIGVAHIGVEQAELGDDERLVLLAVGLHPFAHALDLLREDAHAVVFRAAVDVQARVGGVGVGGAGGGAEAGVALGRQLGQRRVGAQGDLAVAVLVVGAAGVALLQDVEVHVPDIDWHILTVDGLVLVPDEVEILPPPRGHHR